MAPSPATLKLAALLAATQHRSGQAIADALGCTRAAVWKQVEALRQLGIGVEAVRGRGYRLSESLELLDADRIRATLDTVNADRLRSLEVLAATPSTHDEVMARPADERHALAVLAEMQTAGRGRRDRRWLSPFGRNVYLSLGWRFETGLRELSCLPLLVAIAASRALARVGLACVAIKWPNDLVLSGAKLGGCLVEVNGDLNGPCLAVLGVGLNVRMREAPGTQAIGQSWTDVASHAPDVSRNRLAGCLLNELLGALVRFQAEGFAPFREAWERRDALAGHTVRVCRGPETLNGVARGIGGQGGLLLERDGAVEELLAGEVTFQSPS